MSTLVLRPIESVDPAALQALQSAAFADHEPSDLLAQVIAQEAAARPAQLLHDLPSPFGLAAERDGTLVGWTQGHRRGRNEFHMLSSGVASSERRRGVYTELVQAVLAHATAQGYAKITSRHAASNNAVLIAKMRLGFQVSGFEYSEVYGPLVRLGFIVGEARRALYKLRAAPLRSTSP